MVVHGMHQFVVRLPKITIMIMLQYAHTEGCPWDEMTCDEIVKNGNFDMLQYVRNNGCPWHISKVCTIAATHGHLTVLQYLHENGCSWDATTCTMAAKNGHLDVLQYAFNNGCPTISIPYTYKHDNVDEWIRSERKQNRAMNIKPRI